MQVSLHLAGSFDAAWQHVLLPWFEAVAARAPENRGATAVVVPFRSHTHLLRSELLARNISLLGVRFLVPAGLREFLQSAATPRVPMREHLRLLLSSAAERCAVHFQSEDETDDFQVAKAVAREPDRLLHAIDNLTAAGASFAEFASPAVAEIARRFDDILKTCGCVLLPEADCQLLQAARAGQPRFSKLLVTGFDAAHWPHWPLLRAAVSAAEDATVILREPRHEAAELDRIWISTWEEHFGPAQHIAPSDAQLDPRFVRLLTLPESPSDIAARKQEPLDHVEFILGHDTTEQTRAIVALAVAFLSERSCERVTILLPGPGALARLVASELEKLSIPHNDSIAHEMRGVFDTEEWRAWLELQERPQLEPLLRFLEHSRAATALFAPLSLRKIQKSLRRACGDILINAVDVLREYCRSKSEEADYQAIVAGLGGIRLLPENATFKEFLTTASEIFRAFKWTQRVTELNRLARGWSEQFIQALTREHFLRWLTEIFAESSISRDACGDHSYARVQLLRYDEAEFGSWSHVIFTGLNEGVWPPRDDESPFLPDDRIAEINRRNTQESERFGVGQQIARESTALCIGAAQRRALALRQLLNTIESTTRAIGVTVERYTQSPREQAVNPSEFFARLYFSARGEALSQEDIARIQQRTRDWLAQLDLFESAKPDEIEVKQTEIAYRARRTPNAEFGEYEFAFRKDSPPPEQISLSATDMANLLQRPALVWMKVFLGVASGELDVTSWSLATGQWVHRWLASIGTPREQRFVPRPAADEILRRVTAAADDFRGEILAILNACGRTCEPDWWRSGWRNARHLAEQFAQQLAATEDWSRLATEWQLGSPQIIRLTGSEELRVRGRLDLILARDERADEIWIVDYKTGEAKPLRSGARELRKQLIGSEGVQICIYALAFRDDFIDICASLLTREADLERQVSLDDIVAANELWEEIVRIEKTGIFGMLGEIRSEFTFTGDYPLATLPIDQFLLRDKWEHTHPAFAKDQGK
jgi:PD-(D/E)XK nuclease superfamily